MSGTLFLTTGPLETGTPLWLDRLRGLFKSTRAEVLDWPERGLPSVSLATTPARIDAMGRLRQALKRAGGAEVEDVLGALAERLGPGPALPVPSWAQVRRMASEGLRIGAHTDRHYVLSRLDPDAARDEIARSVEIVGRALGTRVESFAYPNGETGDFGDREKAVLRELGIRYACAAVPGFARAGDDPLALRRQPTRAPTVSLFACRVAGLARRSSAAALPAAPPAPVVAR